MKRIYIFTLCTLLIGCNNSGSSGGVNDNPVPDPSVSPTVTPSPTPTVDPVLNGFQVTIPEQLVLPGAVTISATLGNNKSAFVRFELPAGFAVLNTQILASSNNIKIANSNNTYTCELNSSTTSCVLNIAANTASQSTIMYEAAVTSNDDAITNVENIVSPIVQASTKIWKNIGQQSFLRTYNQNSRPQIALGNNGKVVLGINQVSGESSIRLYSLVNNNWQLVTQKGFVTKLPLPNYYLLGHNGSINVLNTESNNGYLYYSAYELHENNTLALRTSYNSGYPSEYQYTINVAIPGISGLYAINNQITTLLPSTKSCQTSICDTDYSYTLYGLDGVVQNIVPITSPSYTYFSYYGNQLYSVDSFYYSASSNVGKLFNATFGGNNQFEIINDSIYSWSLFYTTGNGSIAWKNLLLFTMATSGNTYNLLAYDLNTNRWDYVNLNISDGMYLCKDNLYTFSSYTNANKNYATLNKYDLNNGLSNPSWEMVGGYGFSPGLNYSLTFDDNCTPYISYLDSNDFSSVSVVSYQ